MPKMNYFWVPELFLQYMNYYSRNIRFVNKSMNFNRKYFKLR